MEIDHLTVPVSDYDRSKRFYAERPGALDISIAVDAPDGVDAFHVAAVAAGAQTVEEPGIRPERNDRYYAARVLDPDGNSLEAVHRTAAAGACVAA